MSGRNFTDYLGHLDQAKFLPDANKAFSDLVKAVVETGRGGEFSLKLKVTPPKSDARPQDVELVFVDGSFTTKLPERPRVAERRRLEPPPSTGAGHAPPERGNRLRHRRTASSRLAQIVRCYPPV